MTGLDTDVNQGLLEYDWQSLTDQQSNWKIQ